SERRGRTQIERVRGHTGSIELFRLNHVHGPMSNPRHSHEGTRSAYTDSDRSPAARRGFARRRVGYRCIRAPAVEADVVYGGLPPPPASYTACRGRADVAACRVRSQPQGGLRHERSGCAPAERTADAARTAAEAIGHTAGPKAQSFRDRVERGDRPR